MVRIAVVEPRSAGCGLIDRGRELGYEMVVFTAGHGDRRVPRAHLANASAVETLDTNDDRAVRRRLRALHARRPFAAVVPGFEHYVPLAAAAAADLGLPGLPATTAAALRLKHLMRGRLGARGIDQPRHVVVGDEAEVAGALAAVGLPCVVKPVDQSGSLNVRKVATPAEAVEAFRRVNGYGAGYLDRTSLPLALFEEYVAGPEFSVEGYACGDRVTVLGVTEKLLGPEPWFVEVGHMVPAPLDAVTAGTVEDYTVRVVRALGLRLGPFHAELRLSARGPLLMEVAARLPGDRIPDLLRLATGADLYEATLRCFLGLPPATASREPSPQRRAAPGHPAAGQPAAAGRPGAVSPGRRAGIRFFLRPGLTGYAAMTVAPHVTADPRIHEVGALIAPGQPVPAAASSAGRLGYSIAVGPDYRATADALDAAEHGVCFEQSVPAATAVPAASAVTAPPAAPVLSAVSPIA